MEHKTRLEIKSFEGILGLHDHMPLQDQSLSSFPLTFLALLNEGLSRLFLYLRESVYLLETQTIH